MGKLNARFSAVAGIASTPGVLINIAQQWPAEPSWMAGIASTPGALVNIRASARPAGCPPRMAGIKKPAQGGFFRFGLLTS